MERRNFRTIWLSDIHLGTPGCQAEAVLDFMKHHRSEKLYLVGDIFDFWALSRKPYFPKSHVAVVRKFLSRAERDTEVVFIPGNHDERLREFLPLAMGAITMVDECVHTTADGRTFLVIHGDSFDQVIRYAKWLAWLGDIGYGLLLRSNRTLNCIRRRFGLGYWSLSAHIKLRVKSAVNFIGSFESVIAADVKSRGLDGVICGHIHHSCIKEMEGVLYCNTGDWVESCTALVEHHDGRLEIIRWPHTNFVSAEEAPALAA